MRRSFYEKVKKYGEVNTKKYSYVLEEYGNVARIALADLDTTDAYDNWKIIKIPAKWK